MATRTTDYLKGSVRNLAGKLKKKSINPSNPTGVQLIKGSFSLVGATYNTIGDEIELVEFPDKTYLLGYSINFPDLDSGSTLEYDVVYQNSSGTEVVLQDALAAAQTGASADCVPSATAGLNIPGLDVSEGKLLLEVDAAATGAATGTITFSILVWMGDYISIS